MSVVFDWNWFLVAIPLLVFVVFEFQHRFVGRSECLNCGRNALLVNGINQEGFCGFCHETNAR